MARSANTTARVRVTADTRSAQRNMNRFRRQNRRTSVDIVNSWKRMATGIIGVGTAIESGRRLLQEFTESNRTLIAGTGETGAGLRQLLEVSNRVAQNVGVGLQGAATAAQDLDTIFPSIRAESESLFASLLEDATQLDYVFGQGISGQALRTFRAFTEDAESLAESFDLIAFLSTQTPGGGQAILGFINSYSSSLESFNFSLEESLVLSSRLLRENITVSRFAPGLARVRTRAADAGLVARDLLFQDIEAIQNATTEQERLNLATEAFGAEANAVFLDAIESGVFQLGNLSAALDESRGKLDEYENAAITTGGFLNQVWAALSENAIGSLSSINTALDQVGLTTDDVAQALGSAVGLVGGVLASPTTAVPPLVQSAARAIGDAGFAGFPTTPPQLLEFHPSNTYEINIQAGTVIGEDGAEDVARLVEDALRRSGNDTTIRTSRDIGRGPGPGIR